MSTWYKIQMRQAIIAREKERRIARKSNPLMPEGEGWLPFNGTRLAGKQDVFDLRDDARPSFNFNVGDDLDF